MTLLERLDRCPPVFCRLVARKHRGRAALTRREISERSGFSLRAVDALSRRASWTGLSVETVRDFAAACGVDPLRPKQHIDWFKRRKRSAWKGRELVVARLLRIVSQARTQLPAAGRV